MVALTDTSPKSAEVRDMSEPDYEVNIRTAPDGSDVTFEFCHDKNGETTLTVHTPGKSYCNVVEVEDLQALQNACYAMRELLLGVR
jgi:hypothetical protein